LVVAILSEKQPNPPIVDIANKPIFTSARSFEVIAFYADEIASA
jgi:hypothetical protein